MFLHYWIGSCFGLDNTLHPGYSDPGYPILDILDSLDHYNLLHLDRNLNHHQCYYIVDQFL